MSITLADSLRTYSVCVCMYVTVFYIVRVRVSVYGCVYLKIHPSVMNVLCTGGPTPGARTHPRFTLCY